MKPLFYPDRTLSRFLGDVPETFFGRTIDDILEHDFFRSFEANVREDAKHYRVEIAVPGMSKDDINVVVENHVLMVTAQKQEQKKWWRKHAEYSGTYLQRSFVLPEDARVDTIKARCRDGLLTITIHKADDKTNYRRIAILASGADDVSRPWWTKWRDRFLKLLGKSRCS